MLPIDVRLHESYPAIGQLFQWVTDLEKHGTESHISEHASEVRVARVLYIHSYTYICEVVGVVNEAGE